MKNLLLATCLFYSSWMMGQCTNVTVAVVAEAGCTGLSQISWQLLGSNGTLWLSGGANFTQVICLPDDCYTLNMLDTGGNGWDCVDWTIADFIGDFDWDTNLDDGNFGTDQFELGNGDCAGGGGGGCAIGTEEFNIQVEDGDFPDQLSWQLTLGGAVVVSGLADADVDVCLAPGCYTFEMFDAANNGWNDAEFDISDAANNVVATGTLIAGGYGFVVLSVGGLDCSDTTPGGGGGGGGGTGGGGGPSGTGCGNQIPTADCVSAACACDGFSFALTPTGAGTFVDVPSPGTLGNPSFSGSPPWGGTDAGCLLAGELNSHWIIFTVATSGTLAFSFGQNSNGGQFGFYDWSMWPFNGPTTCSDIANNLVAPARCLWNATTVGGTGLAAPVPAGGNAGNYGPPLNVVAGQQFIICLSNYSFVTTNVVLDFFGTAAIQCATVLASESIALEAHAVNGHYLTWSSQMESPIEAYEVHRSQNGQVWEVAGQLRSGLLTSSEIRQPYYGSNYYRIKGYHPDGSYLFSNTAYMEYLPNEVVIFPNPCSDHMIVRGEAGGHVQIKDLLGQLVAAQWLNDKGELLVNTSDWPVGVYCVITDYQRSQVTKKILVEH